MKRATCSASPFRVVLVPVLIAVTFAACSDDGGQADAAGCTCPAAEPPLAGRIVQRSRLVTITAADGAGRHGFGQNGSPCLAGETLLSGGCLLNELPSDELMLFESGYIDNAIRCGWISRSILAHTGTATAVCLSPP